MKQRDDWQFSGSLGGGAQLRDRNDDKAAPNKQITLIMLSGGLDSTANLVKYLTETEDHVHAHHINLINPIGRGELELQAVRGIVDYCEKNYRPFDFTMSKLDLSFMRRIVPDIYHTNYISGLMAATDPRIKKIGKNAIANDYDDPTYTDRRDVARELFRTLAPPDAMPELEYPLLDMTKSDILDYLPPELVRLTWSCRTPMHTPDGSRRCGKCGTCEQILAGLPTSHGVGPEWFDELIKLR